jgi:hypothetical protein
MSAALPVFCLRVGSFKRKSSIRFDRFGCTEVLGRAGPRAPGSAGIPACNERRRRENVFR